MRFPARKGRGGHNAEPFTPEQITAARSGTTEYYLRKQFPDLSGSRAARLVRDYGPQEERRAL